MARIELKDWPAALENSGETVLETMIANGVPFPYSCASGDCGACKGRVLCGEVAHQSCPEGILSAAERADGYVLACRCTPKNDIRLEALDELVELPAARRQRGWVVSRQKRQGDVIVLRIIPTKPVKFLAGQFFYLKFDNLPQRAYSVASLPGAEELEFHIRVEDNGKTSNYANRDELVGSELIIDGPYGHGYWRQNHDGPIVAIGGGTGLAPMLSVVGAALRENARRRVHLYYAASEEVDVYWEAELAALMRQFPNLRVDCALSRAKPPAHGALPRRYQRVTDSLREDWPNLAGAKLYIAGPPKMVDALAATARELGLAPRDLHTDPFTDSVDHALDGALATWLRRFTARWRRPPFALPQVQAQNG